MPNRAPYLLRVLLRLELHQQAVQMERGRGRQMFHKPGKEVMDGFRAMLQLRRRPDDVHVFARDAPFHRQEVQDDVTLLYDLQASGFSAALREACGGDALPRVD